MPWPRADGQLHIVYRLGTLININGDRVHQSMPLWATDHISGGSQVIKVADGTAMAIVHEARTIPGRVNRYYQHRFVLFQPDGAVIGLSLPFYFHERQIEFCAGLALFGDKLMVSYGVRDEEAWIATMDLSQVMEFIDGKAQTL